MPILLILGLGVGAYLLLSSQGSAAPQQQPGGGGYPVVPYQQPPSNYVPTQSPYFNAVTSYGYTLTLAQAEDAQMLGLDADGYYNALRAAGQGEGAILSGSVPDPNYVP